MRKNQCTSVQNEVRWIELGQKDQAPQTGEVLAGKITEISIRYICNEVGRLAVRAPHPICDW